MRRGFNRAAHLAALALAMGVPVAASAQALVLRSGGPSAGRYPPGSRTPPGASFNLRPGDTLSILAGGTTRNFRGPGSFNASSPSGGGASAGVRVNTGAVRSGETAAAIRTRSDIWQFDVAHSGRACVLAGHPLILWRQNVDQTVQLTITPQVGAARTLGWAVGAETLAWPADLALATNTSYQLSWSADAAPSRLTARALAGVGEGSEAVAAAFIANRCDGQLDVLIARHADAPAVRPARPAGR